MTGRWLSHRRSAPLWASLVCLLAACGPAIDRPASGAVPGRGAAPTAPGVPPTLTASESLTMHALPSPSPGVAAVSVGGTSTPIASPSQTPAVASASPSTTVAPPIVRTISPPANAKLPPGDVTLSAVLVGRGADLASASMAVDGADAGAVIDKRSPRDWVIRAGGTFESGSHAARVQVRDASGAAGGFTWQFSVGDLP